MSVYLKYLRGHIYSQILFITYFEFQIELGLLYIYLPHLESYSKSPISLSQALSVKFPSMTQLVWNTCRYIGHVYL